MGERLQMTVMPADNKDEASGILRAIGTDEAGIAIMQEKMIFRVVRIKEVPLKAAIILKQTFLAKGADAATSREVAGLTAETSDVVLMGTLKQYRQAISALKAQPFGLKNLADDLEQILFC